MHPVLFHLGGHAFHGYGLCIALGILAGLAFGRRELRRLGRNPDLANDVVLLGLVVGVAGGKLAYLATLPRATIARAPLATLSPASGLVWYGVLAAVVPATWLLLRARRLPVLPTLDLGALALSLGHGLGRMGCFLAGCCYGRPTDLPWGVVFSDPLSLAPRGIPLHPTQLYLALHSLGLFALLLVLRRRPHRDGELLVAFLATYAAGRAGIELLRADPARGWLWGLPTSQALSILVLACALVLLAALPWLRPPLDGSERRG